jgi:hypothetical protein
MGELGDGAEEDLIGVLVSGVIDVGVRGQSCVTGWEMMRQWQIL